MKLDFDAEAMVSPETYGTGHPHELWTWLRAEDPVRWCEPDGYRPFWAVTKHEDIRAVSTHPDLFSSAGRWVLLPERVERRTVELYPDAASRGGSAMRSLINMDPPEHRVHRNLAGPFFRPRMLTNLEDRVRDLTRALLDRNAGQDVELDFVDEIAQWHPLRLICEILGMAADDEHVLLQLTNELFAPDDAEFARKDRSMLFTEMFDFFRNLIEEKRANPTEDLASVLATGTIDGELLPHLELISYFVLIATAGHDTTRTALAGGFHALLTHPEQLDRLRSEPTLAKQAADEISRWTSPIVHFMRTATQDTELGGRSIRAGDSVALFYPSANRDEEVFDDPFSFRIDREPNPHLAFGVGEHFCLGASLARMEIRILLEELVPRLRDVEVIGEPERLRANFVTGIKHLPVRWSLT